MKKLLCPLTGANILRLLLSTLAGFVFIFIFDFVLHAQILGETYAQTAHLWRTPAEMHTTFPFMMATQFLTALISAFIFTRNYEGGGITEGLRFGLLLGLLFGVLMVGGYAWLPISATLAAVWGAGGIVMGLGLGVIFSLTYKD